MLSKTASQEAESAYWRARSRMAACAAALLARSAIACGKVGIGPNEAQYRHRARCGRGRRRESRSTEPRRPALPAQRFRRCQCARGRRRHPCWHTRGRDPSPRSTPVNSARSSRSRSQFSSPPWPTMRKRNLPAPRWRSCSFNCHQQCNVLLHREAPDKAQHKITIARVTIAIYG